MSREVALATGPSEGIEDPYERAMSRLMNIEGMRRILLSSGSAEALGMEGELRADRALPAEPTITDEERVKRALNHLEKP
jgi:hypothetical protein